jgi:hypothetical protein
VERNIISILINRYADLKTGDDEATINEIEVIDVSKYQPKNDSSLTWRECIKKIWKDQPQIINQKDSDTISK